VSRGRRSSSGRGDIDDPDTAGFDDVTDEEDPDTSVADLTSEADPSEFDRTFSADGAPLTIAGDFDPTAGSKQVIPRIAYTINYNFVWNPDRGRWEPDTGNSDAGGAGVSIIGVGEDTVSDGSFLQVRTNISDRNLDGDTLDVGFTYQSGATPNDTTFTNVVNPSNAIGAVGYTFGYEDSFGGWFVRLFNDTGSDLDLRVVIYRIEVPDSAASLQVL